MLVIVATVVPVVIGTLMVLEIIGQRASQGVPGASLVRYRGRGAPRAWPGWRNTAPT